MKKRNRIQKMLTPAEYQAKEGKKVKEYELFKMAAPVVGGLIGLLIEVKRYWFSSSPSLGVVEAQIGPGLFSFIVYALLFAGAGALLFWLLSIPLAPILRKVSETRYKRKCEKYTEQYNQEIERESLEYSDSKLVKMAGEQITAFFFRTGICPDKRPTDMETVNSNLSIKVDRSIIDYKIDKDWKLPFSELRTIPHLYQEYLSTFGRINFTSDGWRFEEINDKAMQDMIALALAKEVRSRVEEKAAELDTDENPQCQINVNNKSNNSEIWINYTAKNNNFIPAQKI